ncbi:zinc carboxypeptidase [Gelidibacter algens]|uniref:M14 family metallopeptidase n=1 Tax=Gelidibacter algens TaxID=49280 RepID=UPI000804E50A|nr:M14 family metallopeptidase [Gelidibacter algens]OBX27108.1 zinc carboxypeptidase [Gelidibacter algens]
MKFLYTIILLSSCFIFGQKQTDLSYYLPQSTSYNKAIPTPQSVIGHEVGEWHITHDKLVEYMKALAESSERITLENRGMTYEGRPLILLTITSPKNHQNIDAIRQQHIAATEDNASVTTSNMPIVVNQGFSIHGNEASGSNAALLVAYYLAAAESNDVKEMLDDMVILFDPSFNPDGLQRFAYWANSNKSKNLNPDPNDREYSEVWPGGRSNHYWFDMNRDWLPVQLPESRARLETFHKWLPNILTDHHEMGTNSTFFFQPGIPSRTHPLTPKLNQELTRRIGNFHAEALDKIGSFYYTEESFDDFYYGKGSTFPDINGGIGILFEQASSRGHVQESENGLLTFPFTIRNQFTAALSTLEAAKNMRDVTIDGKKFKKGYSYVIPKNQKNTRLINAMFEKRTTFEDSLFYDVSAWTFPLAFNLDYVEGAASSNMGAEVTDLKMKPGQVSAKSNYAYLMEWHEYYTPKVLNQILKSDLRAKVAMEQFGANGKDYDYGTILVPVQNQSKDADELYNFLNELAKEGHVQIDAVSTGLTKGIDLGSNQFRALTQPKIALIVGSGVSPYDAGEIWHLLDQRYDMTLTKLDTDNLERADLSRYNTIILPSGSLSKSAAETLRKWVENGGTLIGFESAVRWLNTNKFMKLDIKKSERIAKNVTYGQRSDYNGAQVIGGAIFEAKLDRSHPINFGYKNDKLPLFRGSTLFINPDKQSYNNPIQYTKNPLLSGYISKSNLDSLALSVPYQMQRMKRGKVVAFTDNTNFRAFWFGTNKLMMNAIFFREEL